MQQPRVNSYAVLMFGVLSLATSAILVKVTSAPSGVTAFYRLFFSVLIMLPFWGVKYRHEIYEVSKKDWLLSIVSGVFLAFHFILWFESLNYTSVASSTVLVTMQPLFAFLGAYFFFKEAITAKTLLSGLIAIGGSVIISWGDFQISGSALWGDVLALIACALATAYFLFGQEVRSRLSVMTYTFLVYSVSATTLLFYVLLKKEPLIGYSAQDWLYFVLLAIVPTLLGHSLLNWAIKFVSATTVSMAILLEPVGASVMAYFILEEKITASQLAGGFIVIVGVFLFLLKKKNIK